jgi:hypothetical protein
MISYDFTNLNRKTLFIAFEQERQSWLEAGMNEADIFRIHFGDDGKGGDYAVWLAERKHTRTDHKYCPGAPISIEGADPEGVWIPDKRHDLSDVETQFDMERALSVLTELQRFCFIEICLNGRTCRDVASERGKHYTTIAETARLAKEKIKKFF